MMTEMTRFEKAIARIDEINLRDPRTQSFQDKEHPREWIFSQRVYYWLELLNPDASETIRLAARSHTLGRWEVPRAEYEKNVVGYHEWRAKTAEHSAVIAAKVLTDLEFPEGVIQKVTRLITWKLFPKDPEAQLLEDADCLAFCEIKLEDYEKQWDEKKLRRILQGTWAKMSLDAQKLADRLPNASKLRRLIQAS